MQRRGVVVLALGVLLLLCPPNGWAEATDPGSAAGLPQIMPAEPSPALPVGTVPSAAPDAGASSAATLSVSARIQGYLDNPGSAPGLAQPLDGTVRRFYSRRQAQPAWRNDSGWSPQAFAALNAMRHAGLDGFDHRDYRPDAIAKALTHAASGALATPEAIDAVAVADLALSAAFLRYVRDLSGGGLDPREFGWNIPWEYTDPAQLLTNGLTAPDLGAWLDTLSPRNQAYAGLRALLVRYRQIAGQPWAPLGVGPILRPGDRDPRVRQLRKNLETLGDLPPSSDRVAAHRHSGLIRVASTDDEVELPGDRMPVAAGPVYDRALVAAVERFQRRHGIAPDGVIGENTLAQLNISPAERLSEIRANMQRLRWMPRELAPRFVAVNIPGYQLQAVEENQVRFSMRVVAGQPDWPTPIMADWIVSLKFAPTWTIPPKIARTETLKKIRSDPSYISRMGFEVLQNGHRVSPSAISWWRLNEHNFNYTLRQKPGKENALGLIRFSLTNPYDIYLHDTSNPAAFKKFGRNLSHGCVRVEKPAELAAFVMNDPAWTAERFRAEMDAARPHVVMLPSPVPVFLVYFTAWRGANGEAQFRPDIYQLDDKLAAAL